MSVFQVNSNDDQGVLMGNWKKTCEGGISPTVWSGSCAILKQYHSSGGVTVKYGQCWVFGGVTNTSKILSIIESDIIV